MMHPQLLSVVSSSSFTKRMTLWGLLRSEVQHISQWRTCQAFADPPSGTALCRPLRAALRCTRKGCPMACRDSEASPSVAAKLASTVLIGGTSAEEVHAQHPCTHQALLQALQHVPVLPSKRGQSESTEVTL